MAFERQAQTEDRGEFRIDELPPGTHELTVNANGFREAQAEVAVAVSSVREIIVTLCTLVSSESVNVRGQSSSITAQPIDLASVVHQGVISTQDLETLPPAAGSFANIAHLASWNAASRTL